MKESLVSFLDGREEDQFELLRELVLQPSPSRHKAGVDAVGEIIRKSLAPCRMILEVQPEEKLGDQLVFRSQGCREGQPSILLVGHMDTVFPVDSPFNYCREHDGKISGPGVIDMKGGLVTVIFAIKALAENKLLDHIPLTFICNSDEEIGSPNSRTLISQEASKSLFALVFECGGLNGEVVTGRKGKAGYRLEVRGQAGHAAFAGPDKASAIHELAKKIIALEQLNDYQKKIVVNVGVVKGGIGPNSVADFAEAEIDTRFLGMADAQLLAEKIDQIASKCTVPGTRSQLHKRSGRMPMEQTDANRYLHKLVQKQAGYLGVPCVEELRSGVSDANNIAEHGIPVIDGMGPIGDCDHSDREYMIKDSLPARTKLAVFSILAGWDHSNNQ